MFLRSLYSSSPRNVFYIAHVAHLDNQYIYKYGISAKFEQRMKAHRKTFHQFDLQYLKECNYKEHLEDQFEKELKNNRLHMSHIFNGKTQRELFRLSSKGELSDVIQIAEDICFDISLYERSRKPLTVVLDQTNLKESILKL